MADNRQGRLPLYTLRHLQVILPDIQKAIIDMNITFTHILSLSFFSWLSLMTGDLYTAYRHLKGMLLKLLNMRHLPLQGKPYNNPDPIMTYRLSIKIDNSLAYRNSPQACPPNTNHEPYRRQQLEKLSSCILNRRLHKPSLSSPSSRQLRK